MKNILFSCRKTKIMCGNDDCDCPCSDWEYDHSFYYPKGVKANFILKNISFLYYYIISNIIMKIVFRQELKRKYDWKTLLNKHSILLKNHRMDAQNRMVKMGNIGIYTPIRYFMFCIMRTFMKKNWNKDNFKTVKE